MNDLPRIPTYWTGEQALEIVDFLEQIIHAIWLVHGSSMTRAVDRTSTELDKVDPDSLPF